MGKYLIKESPALKGTVKIGGSKNAVLPIMAAALLCDEKCVIHDVPDLTDVYIMGKLLEGTGASVRWDFASETIDINARKLDEIEVSYDYASKMRASFLLMGPLLARKGKARMPLPGGCAIGARPIDLHLKGFAALGANILQERGFVEAECPKGSCLTGATIYLDYPSVGATENIMMAAVLAEGQTILQNCAVEPEIVDLSNFLSSLGAEIRGAGTDTIRISGVKELSGADHCIIPDRIEAGTFMLAAAATRGNVLIQNIVVDHLRPIIAKLKEIGVVADETDSGIRIKADGQIKPTDIKTLPYPGFPTDMQAQFMGALVCANGMSIVTETIFENRFMHVGELSRMGADIKIESRSAIIEGVKKLTGTQVKATDLRAGAALVIASLSASDLTEISGIEHIERGYCNLDAKLKSLGARIVKVED